jgi:hypothetical protein
MGEGLELEKVIELRSVSTLWARMGLYTMELVAGVDSVVSHLGVCHACDLICDLPNGTGVVGCRIMEKKFDKGGKSSSGTQLVSIPVSAPPYRTAKMRRKNSCVDRKSTWSKNGIQGSSSPAAFL